jgi:hypothetical protein
VTTIICPDGKLPIETEGIRGLAVVSDGYHTFDELYEHRRILFIALCKRIRPERVWRSKLHSDGSRYDGWFILGIDRLPDEQITYHLPIALWEATSFAQTLDKAPTFDGHTPADVLERLQRL